MAVDVGNFLSQTPLFGGLFDSSGQDAKDQIAKNQALYENLQVPDLTWDNYNPAAEQSVGNFDPTMANATTVTEDPTDRSAQMSALNQMAGLAQSGLGPQDVAAFTQAQQLANQTASAGEQAAEQGAEAKGMGGSGLSFALGEQARQNAAQQQQMAGLQQAASAAQQRALYGQAYSQGLAGLRSQDYNTQATNANTLNQFNLANTNAANTYGSQNWQNNQNIANTNVQNANAAQQYNKAGATNIAQQNYENQLKKIGGQSGANQGVANTDAAQNAANSSSRNQTLGAISSIAGKAMAM